MNVKAVVKVMNFHALLRVDASRKRADKYLQLEHELSDMIDLITNNRNFILDQEIMEPDPKMPELNIYLGSDFGFCGSVNSAVNSRLAADNGNAMKITVGKKLRQYDDVALRVTRDAFASEFSNIQGLLEQAVRQPKFSRIHLIYNHYHNMSTIEPVKKCIFPMKLEKKHESRYGGDFTVEGQEVGELLTRLIVSYLGYEVKIAYVNSLASENIARENATSQSLKKIDEREEEDHKLMRKVRNQKAFEKVIDSYMKSRGFGGKKA